MANIPYRAAWLPFPGDTTWDSRIRSAIDWVLNAAAEEGTEPLLFTPRQHVGPRPIRDFAARYPSTTPRGAMRGRNRTGSGPVLVYAPDYQMMEMAARFAEGSMLMVVETPPYQMLGWAVEVGAVDLSTGQVTPDTRSDRLRKALKDIQWAGNNGWADKPGARDARVLVRSLPAEERDKTMILGYMVAHGFHKEAIERLGKLID